MTVFIIGGLSRSDYLLFIPRGWWLGREDFMVNTVVTPCFWLFVIKVEGMRGVFSAGDCTSFNEEKTALSADLAASLAARNIERLDSGMELLTYPEGVAYGASLVPTIQNVSLYKYNGILQFNSLILVGWLPAIAKLAIEMHQMMMAKEWWWAIWTWEWIEGTSMFVGKWLFR